MIKQFLFIIGFFLIVSGFFLTLSNSCDYCSCAGYRYGYSYQDYLRDTLIFDSICFVLTILGLTAWFVCFIFYILDSGIIKFEFWSL